MTNKIVIREEPISFTTKGTYKNLQSVLNKMPKNEEFVQIDYSLTHLHLITRKLAKPAEKQFEYKIYDEPISFTMKGTYKNLEKSINKLPKGEEFVQICTTPTHLHMITRKEKGSSSTKQKKSSSSTRKKKK